MKRQLDTATNDHSMGLTRSVRGDPPQAICKIRKVSNKSAAALKTLKIDLVLDLIAKKLPVRDLRALGRTCHSWNQSFVTHGMRHRCRLPDANCGVVELRPRYPDWLAPTVRVPSMQDYTDLMRESQNIPYFAYKIYDLQRSELSRQDYQDFFAVCGSSIKHLTLNCKWDRPVSVESVDRIRQVVSQHCPGLTNLTLILHAPIYDEDEGRVPQPQPTKLTKLQAISVKIGICIRLSVFRELITDLLRWSPHLENVAIESESLQLLEIVHNALAVPQLGALTTLRAPNLGIQEFQVLVEMGPSLRLKSLAVSIKPERDQEKIRIIGNLLHEFLTSQANSLQELRLGIGRTRHDISGLRLPRMEHLQTFSFSRTSESAKAPVRYEGDKMQNAFPQLKRFELTFHTLDFEWVCDWRDMRLHDMPAMSHDRVTELVLDLSKNDDDGDGPDDQMDLRPLAARLPSITKLDIGFNSKIKKGSTEIWTAWPNLVSVRIRYEKEVRCGWHKLDELLTGVPWKDHPKLQVECTKAEVTTPPFQVRPLGGLVRRFKKQPGLADLKQLKLKEFRLELSVPASDIGKPTLSDTGGYLGLALANSGLQRMEVCVVRRAGQDTPATNGIKKRVNKEPFTPRCKKFIRSSFHSTTSIVFR